MSVETESRDKKHANCGLFSYQIDVSVSLCPPVCCCDSPFPHHSVASLNPQTDPTTRIDPTMTGLFCLPEEGRADRG